MGLSCFIHFFGSFVVLLPIGHFVNWSWSVRNGKNEGREEKRGILSLAPYPLPSLQPINECLKKLGPYYINDLTLWLFSRALCVEGSRAAQKFWFWFWNQKKFWVFSLLVLVLTFGVSLLGFQKFFTLDKIHIFS